MKVLVIGNGGREHAIAWKLSKSHKVNRIYCAPGNGGTAIEKKCENVNIKSNEELLNFAIEKKIDITVIGPEMYLCDGIVDLFKAKGLKIFGPSKVAAMLEGSKSFAKEFMKKYGVKTAAYETFEDYNLAFNYIKCCSYPIVIKADGLAAGKGVVIATTSEEAVKTLKEFMVEDVFQGSGKKIIIEEFLQGVEASILTITDGKVILPMVSSKDHKTIFDGGQGPNTGGMGTIAPNPYCTAEVLKEFQEHILEPTLKGIVEEGFDYIGIIFFGLMITERGVYLIEYNVRMGDPETQVVLPLMKNDLLELIESALDRKLEQVDLVFENKIACCVIAASKGYPSAYEKGLIIDGIDKCNGTVFIAGAEIQEEMLVTNGGRVLGVTALGNNIEDCRANAYKEISKINFSGIYYRNDIGI